VESYFICKWDIGSREGTLIIKGDRSGAKTMTFSFFSDSRAEEYRIEETTDLFYKAVKAKPPASNELVRWWIELNRVSGELFSVARLISDNSAEGPHPRAECRSADRRF
jgi:hypothetical protein